MKKNQRGEMRVRCREQREGGDAESRGGAERMFRVRKHSIYTCFFKWWFG
jgi:hypothetical protein